MPAIRVTYQGTRIDQPNLVEQASPIIRSTHRKLQRQIVELAKLRAPRGATGNLRRQIRADQQMFTDLLTMQGGVTSHAGYSAAVHEGSRPHIIRATRARDLAFPWGGRMAFFKQVHHPGNKPNPFLTEAAHEALETDPDITVGG